MNVGHNFNFSHLPSYPGCDDPPLVRTRTNDTNQLDTIERDEGRISLCLTRVPVAQTPLSCRYGSLLEQAERHEGQSDVRSKVEHSRTSATCFLSLFFTSVPL